MSDGKSVSASRSYAAEARAGGGGVGVEQGGRASSSPREVPSQEGRPVPVLPRRQERGVRIRDDWPLRSSLELGILPGAVPCARLHAKQVLWEWGLSDLSESVELLVSELVTNAVQVSQSMPHASSVRLWLRSDKTRVLMLVWDTNSHPPVRIDATEDAESGRGLLLVEALSDTWNWYRVKGMKGKIVWAEVLRTSPELSRRVPGEYS